MTAASPVLYLRTLSYLKAEQIRYLVRNSLRAHAPALFRPRIPEPPDDPSLNELNPKTPFPENSYQEGYEVSTGEFRFLNESADYPDGVDWTARGKSRLWKYHLHSFRYLHAAQGGGPSAVIPLIHDWISANPPCTQDSWDPFPVSLRIVNWIKFFVRHRMNGQENAAICRSLYRQTSWLEQSLERHLQANHLFKNLKALIFAGLFFGGEDSARWLHTGIKMLQHELHQQILPDGGHIERSLMYQCMIVEDCLDLLNVCDGHHSKPVVNACKLLKDAAGSMLSFLIGMTHPDGQISLFNDSALGAEASPARLTSYHEGITGRFPAGPEPPLWAFPDSGYYVMAPCPGDRLIVDCGPIGPDYQPGHAHCDTLSFELSLGGQRVIVDSGCYAYEDSEMRRYNRGNAGHNVLTINGEDQSEIWSTYRVARRARPLEPVLSGDASGLLFEGGHDGYRRLRGCHVHRRRIRWRGTSLSIEDEVSGKGSFDFVSRLHINPELSCTDLQGEVRVSGGNKTLAIRPLICGDASFSVDRGWYCPEFGKRIPCSVLVLKGRGNGNSRTGWEMEIGLAGD